MAEQRHLMAEFVGTAFLLAAVVGSAIAAERLTDDAGVALLIGAGVTGAVLAVMIAVCIEISGAHFNPAVTIAAWRLTSFPGRLVVPYVAAQGLGAVVGVVTANLMFELDPFSRGATERWGAGAGLGEVVATFGLVTLIFVLVRTDRLSAIPFGVGAFIAGAYFFTSSTAFANPAVTVARMLSDSPAGIAPSSMPGFVFVQFVGMALAIAAVRLLAPAGVRQGANRR